MYYCTSKRVKAATAVRGFLEIEEPLKFAGGPWIHNELGTVLFFQPSNEQRDWRLRFSFSVQIRPGQADSGCGILEG